VGREPATLIRTAGSNFALPGAHDARPNPVTGDIDAMAATIAGFRDLGLQHYIAGIDPCTPESLETFAQVLEILDRAEEPS
jgi:hypothetical protein